MVLSFTEWSQISSWNKENLKRKKTHWKLCEQSAFSFASLGSLLGQTKLGQHYGEGKYLLTKGLLFFVEWLLSSEDAKGPTYEPSFLINIMLPFFWQWDYLQEGFPELWVFYFYVLKWWCVCSKKAARAYFWAASCVSMSGLRCISYLERSAGET